MAIRQPSKTGLPFRETPVCGGTSGLSKQLVRDLAWSPICITSWAPMVAYVQVTMAWSPKGDKSDRGTISEMLEHRSTRAFTTLCLNQSNPSISTETKGPCGPQIKLDRGSTWIAESLSLGAKPNRRTKVISAGNLQTWIAQSLSLGPNLIGEPR